MLTIDKIKRIVTDISKKYGVKRVYLFGSYAKNKATDDSDVDLIIDKGDIHTFKDYFHFYKDLESGLGTDVDLITESSIRPRFFEKIKNDRIFLYGA